MPLRNPRSTARIGKHPIHPMLVYFPIAFFVGAFCSDIFSLAFADARWWAQASYYLLGAGLLTSVLAAVAGLIDFVSEPRIRQLHDAWWHAGTNITVVVLEALNWLMRYDGGTNAVNSTELMLSVIASVLLIFSGWKGGELVYRHRVAVRDDDGTAER